MACWLERNDIVIVVTHENPGGSNRRYGSDTSRRNARNPEFRSGIFVDDNVSASFRIKYLAGTRKILCVPCSLVRAPTTWSTSGWSMRYWTNSGIRSFG